MAGRLLGLPGRWPLDASFGGKSVDVLARVPGPAADLGEGQCAVVPGRITSRLDDRLSQPLFGLRVGGCGDVEVAGGFGVGRGSAAWRHGADCRMPSIALCGHDSRSGCRGDLT
jgi:hypothetical protein